MKTKILMVGAVLFVACSKKTDETKATENGIKSNTVAASCDLGAFEKEQNDKGRSAGTARSFKGCKFKSYNASSRTVFFEKGTATDSLSCVNVADPKLAAGDSVSIEGTEDGGGDLQLYKCTITKI